MRLKFLDHPLGDLTARYVLDEESGRISLCLLPEGTASRHAERRTWLNAPELKGIGQDIRAWQVGALAHVALSQHPRSRGAGQTLKHGHSTDQLRFESQRVEASERETRVVTVLRAPIGYGVRHALIHRPGLPGAMIQTEFFNDSDAPVTLELLTSFALDDLSPYSAGDSANRLILHRVRGGWAEEGLRQKDSAAALGLEAAWAYVFPESERYGALGGYPVGRYFPYGAVEDADSGVIWGAWISHNASWQMEFSRVDDGFSFSGGLADREFGAWSKQIAPGERFCAPQALVSAVRGPLEALNRRLMDLFQLVDEAGNDGGAGWVFNEWCTSWGNPTHDGMLRIAKALKGLPVGAVIIDAGWTDVLPGSFGQGGNGDWLPSAQKFPQGIGETARALREMGYVPGIWFEFEVATPGSRLYDAPDDWFLRADGRVIVAGDRKFLDFTNPKVSAYLRERVIDFLRENRIGYLKVDFNGNPGQGCDGAESPGEGLRHQAQAVYNFFREIRSALPDIRIENCASGGHRDEPLMMGISEMTSISDAHECLEIPVVAARLTGLLPPQKSQIWAVVNPELSDALLRYRLCSGFFGRMCLSGRIFELSEAQMNILRGAAAHYEACAAVIRQGLSTTARAHEGELRRLKGAQVVFRALGRRLMVTAHLFDPFTRLEIPLPPGDWHIVSAFSGADARVADGRLIVEGAGAPDAFSYLLESEAMA